MKINRECVGAENIHTPPPPTEGGWNSEGEGGSEPKISKGISKRFVLTIEKGMEINKSLLHSVDA